MKFAMKCFSSMKCCETADKLLKMCIKRQKSYTNILQTNCLRKKNFRMSYHGKEASRNFGNFGTSYVKNEKN